MFVSFSGELSWRSGVLLLISVSNPLGAALNAEEGELTGGKFARGSYSGSRGQCVLIDEVDPLGKRVSLFAELGRVNEQSA